MESLGCVVEDALTEIERLPGRHLYFLDDPLFGNVSFATALFDGMRGMGRVWQATASREQRKPHNLNRDYAAD